MATIRTGSDAVVLQHNSAAPIALYTGSRGELLMSQDRIALVLHDGSTQGGFTLQATSAAPLSAMATVSEVVTKINTILTNLTAAKLMG